MVKRLYVLGWITLVGFPLIGWFLLDWFVDDPFAVMMRAESSLPTQLAVGLVVGALGGWGAQWVVRRPFMRKTEKKYAVVVHRLRLTRTAVIFLSICAGVGEELLFRGAIQPLIGIWPTALVFVAIHGYLNPFQWRMALYGVYMTVLIAILGYLVNWFGIWAACAAHAVIDVILFRYLVRRGKQLTSVYLPDHEST